MATEDRRGRKCLLPTLPALLVKEKIKRKVTAVRSSRKSKKLRLSETESKKSEQFVHDADSTKNFSILPQPLPPTNKFKINATKLDRKHTVMRAELQHQNSSCKTNNNVSDTNDNSDNIHTTTKTELETSTEKNALCPTDVTQPVNLTKNEVLQCEVISGSQEMGNEVQDSGTLNITNTVHTEDKSATDEKEVCNVHRQSPEVPLENNHTESLECIGHVLMQQDTSTCNAKSQQSILVIAQDDDNPIFITSTILHTSQIEISKETEDDKGATSQNKQTQQVLDLVNTACSTVDTDCLVNPQEQQTNSCTHYEKKINSSKESLPELLVTDDGHGKFVTQNVNNQQACGPRITDDISDAGCCDIVGNSQEHEDHVLQLSITRNFRVAEHQDILNACIRTCPGELHCITQPNNSLSPHKSEEIKGYVADENIPLIAESKSQTNETNKDNKFSDLLLKQETDMHTDKLLEMENEGDKTELLSDKNLHEVKQDDGDLLEQIENPVQNDKVQHEKVSLSEETKNFDGENKDKYLYENPPTLEICIKNGIGQTNISEETPSTSLQVANLDDDLEISTSQLLKLESEFDTEVIQLDNLHPPLDEPTASHSVLPRHIRAPTIDWTQRAEHNRQRLQTIIQDICKLNAMLARARRMVWKQQPP